MLKRIFSVMCTLLLVAIIFTSFMPANANAETVEDALDILVDYYQQNKPQLTDWEEIISLSEAGVIDQYDTSYWEENISLDSPTDYAAAILGLTAAGQDPEQFQADINLIDQLVAKQQGDGGFGGSINNTIYAILALDQVEADYNRLSAINYLMNQQKSDGGFSISGSSGDSDTTGMALMALASHRDLPEVKSEVEDCINEAITFLHNKQLASGGFSSGDIENAESTAKVIQGLMAVNENLEENWTKDNNNIIDALFQFWLADGSFSHTINGDNDAYATKQALAAMVKLNTYYPTYVLKVNGDGGQGEVGDEKEKQVKVRVEGVAGKLAAGEVNINGTALDALVALVGAENVNAPGGFISSIKGESGIAVNETDNTYWGFYVIRNGAIDVSSFDYGANGFDIIDGDEVVFYNGVYGKTYFPQIKTQPTTPKEGEMVTVSVNVKKYEWGQGLLDIPVDGIKVIINGEEQLLTAENNYVTLEAISGEQNIRVEKYVDGYPELVPAEMTMVILVSGGQETVPSKISVKVTVIGKDEEEIYDGWVDLDKDDANVLQALDETGLSYRTKWGGTYVSEIEGLKEENSSTAGWKYKIHGEIPGIPARDYTVKDGDRITWFWASDAEDTGEEKILVEEIVEVPTERLEAVKESQKQAAAEIEKQIMVAATSNLDLFNVVELAKNETIVVGKENPLTEDERKAWIDALEKNKVNIKQTVKANEETEVADTVGEVSLKINKDALIKDTTITVKEIKDDQLEKPVTHNIISPIYDFGPDGTTFAKPVALTIKQVLPKDMTPENIVLAWYNPQNNSWIAIPTVVNVTTGEITGVINHFSKYALLEQTGKFTTFKDIDANGYSWAEGAINYLAVKNIVSGTVDGNFNPEKQVTRAEFVSMLVRALGVEASAKGATFSDVAPTEWCAESINAAVAVGLVSGYQDGTFRPHQQITREQMAALLTRALDLQPISSGLNFTDAAAISPWARDAVQAAVDNQLISGYSDGTFKPQSTATRAETAVLIYRLLKLK